MIKSLIYVPSSVIEFDEWEEAYALHCSRIRDQGYLGVGLRGVQTRIHSSLISMDLANSQGFLGHMQIIVARSVSLIPYSTIVSGDSKY